MASGVPREYMFALGPPNRAGDALSVCSGRNRSEAEPGNSEFWQVGAEHNQHKCDRHAEE